MVIPVVGLMMGMTLRVRLAAGWLKLTLLGLAATLAPTLVWTKALVEAGEREMAGVTCCTGWIWCCRGEVSGEPLESEERSDEAEWMECSYKIKMSTTNKFERLRCCCCRCFCSWPTVGRPSQQGVVLIRGAQGHDGGGRKGEGSRCRNRQSQRTSSSVRRLGQNSKSSSRSKERPASNRARKAVTAGASASSRMLLTPRN